MQIFGLDGVPPMLLAALRFDFAVLPARIVLGEHLTIAQWSGCLLVIIGLLVAMFGRQVFKRLVFQDQQ